MVQAQTDTANRNANFKSAKDKVAKLGLINININKKKAAPDLYDFVMSLIESEKLHGIKPLKEDIDGVKKSIGVLDIFKKIKNGGLVLEGMDKKLYKVNSVLGFLNALTAEPVFKSIQTQEEYGRTLSGVAMKLSIFLSLPENAKDKAALSDVKYTSGSKPGF